MLQRKIRSYTLYEIFFYFLIYSCLGWVFETLYTAATSGHFQDRGFLYSPFCPIYGFAIVVAILALESVKKNIFALFVGGTILVSSVEYLTGVLMLDIFGRRWWDYSAFPYNLNGHITLAVSIGWGVACVLIVRFLHPAIVRLVVRIDHAVGRRILFTVYSVLLIDNVVSATHALMNR